MDSVILAAAIKLYKKLLSFIIDYQSDVFGIGNGNIFIGTDSSEVPAGFTRWTTDSNNTYTLDASDVPQFNNLIIDSDCSLTSNSYYLFLYVKDTLRVKVNARVHLDKKGVASYTFSPFLARAEAGNSTPSYTASCLKLFMSGRDVRTPFDLSVTGSNAPSGINGISGAGTIGGGGGVVCLFHGADGLKGYNVSTESEVGISTDFVTANGGSNDTNVTGIGNGGGMLFIFARNIIIETDSTTAHGTISANGGDGLGIRSYINSNPGSRTDNPSGQINDAYGGGGVVHHVELDVM